MVLYLAMDVLLLRVRFAGMCLPSRCLVIGIHVIIIMYLALKSVASCLTWNLAGLTVRKLGFYRQVFMCKKKTCTVILENIMKYWSTLLIINWIQHKFSYWYFKTNDYEIVYHTLVLSHLLHCCWPSPAEALLFPSLTDLRRNFTVSRFWETVSLNLVSLPRLLQNIWFLGTYCRHFPNTIVTMDTIKHTKIAYTLPLYSQWFYLAGVNGERKWTGLETMHVTATLTNVLALFLQEEKLQTIQCFFFLFFWRNTIGKIDGRTNVWVLCLFLYLDAVNVTSAVLIKTLFLLYLQTEEGVENFPFSFVVWQGTFQVRVGKWTH
jgi:hypothetical protein